VVVNIKKKTNKEIERTVKLENVFSNDIKEILFNKKLIEKPYSRYIKIGGIGEKIFYDYYMKKGWNITKAETFVYKLILYERKKAVENDYLYEYSKGHYRSLKVDKFISMFSKEQLKFLKEKGYLNPDYDTSKKTGLPDFFIWNDNGVFGFVEIKTGSSLLSDIQRKTISELKELFDVFICHIDFEVVVKDLDIKKIDFGFIEAKDIVKEGRLNEVSLYQEIHIKKRKNSNMEKVLLDQVKDVKDKGSIIKYIEDLRKRKKVVKNG